MNYIKIIVAVMMSSSLVPALSGMHRPAQRRPAAPVTHRSSAAVAQTHRSSALVQAEATYQRELARALALSREGATHQVPVQTVRTATRPTMRRQQTTATRSTGRSSTATSYEADLQKAINESLKEQERQKQIEADAALAQKIQGNGSGCTTTTTTVTHHQTTGPTNGSQAKGQQKTSAQIPLIHLNTNHQTGLECGLRAVTNAKAIQNLVKQAKQITEQTLKAEELNVYKQVCLTAKVSQNLSIDDVGVLAQKIGLANLYPLGIDKKSNGTIYTIGNGSVGLKEAIQVLSITDDLVHFVINTGGHWVVLTVVHNKQGYRIFHIDSMNGGASASVTPYVAYIKHLISLV